MTNAIKPFSNKLTSRYDGSKQIIIYVDSRVYEKLSKLYPGASNAVMVGTVIEAVFGVSFVNKYNLIWPRNAVPWRIWQRSDKSALDAGEPRRRIAEPRPASAAATTRRGRISLAAWFPSEIADEALMIARSGETKYSECGRTLHCVLLNCAADLTGAPLLVHRTVGKLPPAVKSRAATKKKLVAKPAAKPVAKKPAAKPVAKKPTAKPVAKKPTAKPVAKRPVAKPVTEKPLAKASRTPGKVQARQRRYA